MRRLSNARGVLQGGAEIALIFDNAYMVGLSGRVESTQPECHALTADVQSLEDGATLTINSIAYTVKTSQPDGTGISLLTLWAA